MDSAEHGNPPHEHAQASPTPIVSGKPIHGSPIQGQLAQVVLVQPQYSAVRRWFAWLGWVGFFFCLMALIGISVAFKDYFNASKGIQEKFFSGATALTGDKVAVINISGVIGDGNGFAKNQIDRVRDDEKVKAVVLRVNSPGGTITGSDYIYHHLCKLRDERDLKIVVSMGSMAASGGYYVAMAVGDQENSIYAEPTTTTGSIGVLIPHYDISGLMERFDIKDDSLVSHPRKKMLSMTKPMTKDHEEILQAYLQSAFVRFKDIVKAGRPKFRENVAALDEVATGEIFTAERAKEVGLVDELGFIEDAIDRAIELASLNKDTTRVVKYAAPPSLANAMGLMSAPSTKSFDFESLLELSAPKAYYLSTSLPVLVSTFQSLAREIGK